MADRLKELDEYIGAMDVGQAWDDYFCLQAMEILADFASDDWVRLTETWKSYRQNFKNCFLSVVSEIKTPDYKYAVPLILQELRHDEQLDLMETVRHFLNTVTKDDPVWRVEQTLIDDLTKQMKNFSYRACFLEEVVTRLSL